MKITIENTNGQKYLMTGTEFLVEFIKYSNKEPVESLGVGHVFQNFLSTYEEERGGGGSDGVVRDGKTGKPLHPKKGDVVAEFRERNEEQKCLHCGGQASICKETCLENGDWEPRTDV